MNNLFIGNKVVYVENVDSSNAEMQRMLAKEILPEGTLIAAGTQTHGKGQRSAKWLSDPGKNITISIFLQPHFLKPEDQFRLSKAVALGVMEFVQEKIEDYYNKNEVKIKWPNDIYIGKRKVAGILIENSISGKLISQSIVGIGVNVNQGEFSSDAPNATSITLVTGRLSDLNLCLPALSSCIERRYLQLRNIGLSGGERFRKIDEDYLQNLFLIEEWADYFYKDKVIKAKVTGVSETGELLLMSASEKEIRCEVKEISYLHESLSF